MSGIPALAAEYKNEMRLIPGENPVILYQDKQRKNKDCGPMMERAKELIGKLEKLTPPRGSERS